jgi:dTDP-4-dehydrorhamnose reductase
VTLPRRVVVFGGSGQLGRELGRTAPAGVEVTLLDRAAGDVRHPDQVAAALDRTSAELVINAAAYTAVDRAEADTAAAFEVNAAGAEHVAVAAAARGLRMLHVSTDFVFDGGHGRPYAPDATPHPLGVYGASKLDGERRVQSALGVSAVVIRTAWLYASEGANFVHTMLRLLATRDAVQVVADQVGTPTWARSLARALWCTAERPQVAGLVHWTDAGVASWYDFAVAIREEALQAGLLAHAAPVHPIDTSQYPTAARRPSFSVLDKASTWRALGLTPVHWRENLRCMLSELPRG